MVHIWEGLLEIDLGLSMVGDQYLVHYIRYLNVRFRGATYGSLAIDKPIFLDILFCYICNPYE